ncbi:MAG: transporter substrate-binding domain-containing protein [Erysipelotrichaceae bacterium]|nr:transporter substrate-binding domain-containing protein [Erysipelotrichaceae bacterium]
MKKVILALLVVSLLALTGCTKKDEKGKDYRTAKSIADLEGMTISVQSGTIHVQCAEQIKNATIKEYPEIPDEVIALKTGVVDGFVADEPQAISLEGKDDTLTYIRLVNNENGFKVEPSVSGISIGLAEGNPLRDEMNKIIATLTPEITNKLIEEVLKVSIGEKIDKYSIDMTEPAEYKGVLKVGMECASEPFNWLDETGETFDAYPLSGEGKEGMYCNGFDVLISRYIAAQLGYKLEIYEVDWDSLIPSVQSGKIDAIISSMSPTAQREEIIDFTDVYYDINLVVVIKK